MARHLPQSTPDPLGSDRRRWVLAALDQFEGRLLRYAQRLLGNLGSNSGVARDDARDVVQFAFLKLCDQSPESIGDRLAQWLYTVCRNRALDILRCRERPPWRSVGWDKLNRVPVVCEANHSSPCDRVEQAELHALLRDLINHLPTTQREALDLWSDGFTYAEISRITNKQEGHIRVLVHRGLTALREHPRVRALTTDEPRVPRPVHGASPFRPAVYGG